jgi:NADPH:quinone reductase-like Zn-dependent oxidoreductase
VSWAHALPLTNLTLQSANWKVITTCSPRNFDLARSLGADEVFDYSETDCGTKIREHTSNKLSYAWDTISLPVSMQICADALTSESGAHYGCLLKPDLPRKDVGTTYTLAYRAFGDTFHKRGTTFKAEELQEDYNFAVEWASIFEQLLAEGKVKVHPPKVMDGGLEKVLDGLDLLRKDKVSGQKLVYRVG